MDDDFQLEQPVNNRAFSRLLAYMKDHRPTLILAFTLLILGTSADVVGPLLIKNFIDNYLTPERFPRGPLVLLGGSYLGLQLTAVVLNYLQMILFQTIALKIIQRLRIDVFAKVQHLGLEFFDRTPTGSLVSRITNDTETIKDLYVSVLSTFVQNIVFLIGVFVSMFVLNWKMAAICLVLLPLLALIMQAYRRFSSKLYHQARQRLSRINAKLNESLQGMYIIQALNQESRVRREFGSINQSYYEVRLRNIKLNSLLLRPLTDALYLLALILVLGYFGIHSFTTQVDIGVFYVFINYLDRFFEPINAMMMRLNVFQQALVSAQRVFELLDEKRMAPVQVPPLHGVRVPAPVATNATPATSETPDHQPLISHGEIRFEHVSFSYDGKTEVLKDITFTAKPGQTVALVGHTGSGKSSITNLLLRFYPIAKGSITIDGVPLQQYSDDELRRKIGLVLQDPFLFAGDILRNIRLGNEHISEEQVEEAARFVQADPFIRKLPRGYHEQIGERGITFSSGQRQLLSFARTMALRPKILVLDEATANIDTETEELIQAALEKMRRGRTTLAIAHRLSTIQDADLILVLHHGEIVERGSHQELLAEEGLYHKMYLLQQGALQTAADF
ncbi:MAG: multidrug ABC transporter ATP-binding protein [Alicyclobacillus sp. RIFOXYA1_FULL_53_8]|nr:MAG: multidrug ABC transporter ATP-binding protein [Alicyclobacillus sp. RIFOXYA1_FULL_53_8]